MIQTLTPLLTWAVTHSSSHSSKAWEHLQSWRIWAGHKAEIQSWASQHIQCNSMNYQLFSWPEHCLGTLAGCIPSCTGVNSREKVKARLVLKGLGGCIQQNTGMLCLTPAELWKMHELTFLPTQLWVMTVSLWSSRGSCHLLINISKCT